MSSATSPEASSVSLLHRAWRCIYWSPRDALLWARLGFPRRVIYFGGRGYGDDLLLHSVAHELRRRGIRTGILAAHPELFRGSPAICGTLGQKWRACAAVGRFGGEAQHLPYFFQNCAPTHDVPVDHHIIAEMCRRAGIRGTITLRTYIYLTHSERAAGRLLRRQAVVQALSPQSENISPLKIYPAERLAEVVRATTDELEWIQLGGSSDPALPVALDLRGKTTSRESAAILAHSRVHLGNAGFLMHLARAVDCRSVIIFGGRELPRHGGYACNENLFSAMWCAPCYRRRDSLAELECMRRIGSKEVIDAVRRVLARVDIPIPEETAEVPEHAVPFALPWLTHNTSAHRRHA